MVVLPQWTERITNTDVVGEDHLGVGTAAINQQEELLPGIISVTDHARYYSLYCWILCRFIHDERHDRRLKNLRGPYFKRLELAHTMACYGHHESEKGLPGVIGSQRMGVILREVNPIDLDANINRYFQNPLGGFGQYYLNAMKLMGLMSDQPNNSDVYQLTERGLKLAQAYDASIKTTRYISQLEQVKDITQLSYEDATDYGTAACLCADAVSRGKDRDLLREVLFRFEDGPDVKSWHHARQLSLGLLLDMVRQSGDVRFIDAPGARGAMRYVLYLGEYAPGHPYEPLPALRLTYEGWRAVQARQLYASSLEILWAVFLTYLQKDAIDGVTLDEFMNIDQDDSIIAMMNTSFMTLIHENMDHVSLDSDAHNTSQYVEKLKFTQDALSLFDQQIDQREFTTWHAMDMLSDIFLRFYHLHTEQDPIWKKFTAATEESHRLPIAPFFDSFAQRFESGQTLSQIMRWLYQDYVLAQHEYIAIRKLRYNRYDTFKFHYSEGRFYKTGTPYFQPLRHLSLRLSNALTMLIDVGLVVKDISGVCHLSPDGETYLRRVEELNRGS